MRVAFRYEDATAMIILIPDSKAEEAQLQMCQQYVTKNILAKLGKDESLVIQFAPEAINGAAH